MALLDLLNRPLQVLIKLSHLISSFALYPAMVAVITVDVTGRFLFHSPLS